MAKTVNCPTCGRLRLVPEQFAAPEVTCTNCGTRYRTATGVLVRMNADRDISEKGLFYLKGSRVMAVLTGLATASLGGYFIYESSAIVSSRFAALVWVVIIVLIAAGLTYLVCGSRMGVNSSERPPVIALMIGAMHALFSLQSLDTMARALAESSGGDIYRTGVLVFWWRVAAMFVLLTGLLVVFLTRYLMEDYLAKLQRDEPQKLAGGPLWVVVRIASFVLAALVAARWITGTAVDLGTWLDQNAAPGGPWRYLLCQSLLMGPLMVAGYIWCGVWATRRGTRGPLVAMLAVAGLQLSWIIAEHLHALSTGQWSATFSNAVLGEGGPRLGEDRLWLLNENIWLGNFMTVILVFFFAAGFFRVARMEPVAEKEEKEAQAQAMRNEAAARVLSGSRMAGMALGMIAGTISVIGGLALLGALVFAFVPVSASADVLPGIVVLWLVVMALGHVAMGVIYLLGALSFRKFTTKMPRVVAVTAGLHAIMLFCGLSPANVGGGSEAAFVDVAFLMMLGAVVFANIRIMREKEIVIETQPDNLLKPASARVALLK